MFHHEHIPLEWKVWQELLELEPTVLIYKNVLQRHYVKPVHFYEVLGEKK